MHTWVECVRVCVCMRAVVCVWMTVYVYALMAVCLVCVCSRLSQGAFLFEGNFDSLASLF